MTNARFPSTRCSVLERLNRDDESERRAAFDLLVHAYWQPIYAYLRLRWRQDSHDAEDTTQAFLAAAWEREFFAGYDASKARFRTFLRLCLDRFVQNQRKAAQAEKRGGRFALVPLDFSSLESGLDLSGPSMDFDELFRQEFLRFLFARVIVRLQTELSARDRQIVFAVFERYDLDAPGGRAYADIAQELSIPLTQVTNHLHTARRRFRALLFEELRLLSDNDAEFRADVRELLGVEVA